MQVRGHELVCHARRALRDRARAHAEACKSTLKQKKHMLPAAALRMHGHASAHGAPRHAALICAVEHL